MKLVRLSFSYMDTEAQTQIASSDCVHDDSRHDVERDEGSCNDESQVASSDLAWSHLVEERWSLDLIASIASRIHFPVDILLAKSCHQLCFVNDILPCAPLALKPD